MISTENFDIFNKLKITVLEYVEIKKCSLKIVTSMCVSCHLINTVESPLTNHPPLGGWGGGVPARRPCSQLVAHHKKDNF